MVEQIEDEFGPDVVSGGGDDVDIVQDFGWIRTDGNGSTTTTATATTAATATAIIPVVGGFKGSCSIAGASRGSRSFLRVSSNSGGGGGGALVHRDGDGDGCSYGDYFDRITGSCGRGRVRTRTRPSVRPTTSICSGNTTSRSYN